MKKVLGLFDVYSIATGAMISSGLFVLPGLAFALAGPGMFLAYAAAGLLMIPVMLATAELASAMPKTGGVYFFVDRSLGPLAGTLAGITGWLSIALKASFALVGIGSLYLVVFPEGGVLGLKLTAVAGCLLFTLLNVVSIKGVGRLQTALTVALLGILATYVVIGGAELTVTRYVPLLPHGLRPVLVLTGLVFISYGGLINVATIGEEVQRAERNIPLGMFLSLVTVGVVYGSVVFVTTGLVEPQALSGSLVPLSLGAEHTLGKLGLIVIDVGAFLAFATTANPGILAASRLPVAMSRDRLLPKPLAQISASFNTPHLAIVATGLLMAAAVWFLDLPVLVATASTVMLLSYVLICAALLVMHQSRVQNYRPTFRAPGCPWLPLGGILAYSALIITMGTGPLLLTFAIILVAGLWYVFYVRRRIARDSALVVLVQRVLARDLVRSDLEEELKQITLERDQVVYDRFDHLVHDAPVLDLPGPLSLADFLRAAAQTLAPRLRLGEDQLYQALLAREQESHTIVKPGLAVPHTIVEGVHVFDLLLVRCRGGITFPEDPSPVTTAFVLVGSADERNYHLRALMTIAHIIGETQFAERWDAARGPEELRDVVLLSERQREG